MTVSFIVGYIRGNMHDCIGSCCQWMILKNKTNFSIRKKSNLPVVALPIVVVLIEMCPVIPEVVWLVAAFAVVVVSIGKVVVPAVVVVTGEVPVVPVANK